MKASELIKELHKMIDKHGDLDILTECCYDTCDNYIASHIIIEEGEAGTGASNDRVTGFLVG